MADPAGPSVVQRLVGVYDADGTLRGELTYLVGARLGRAHCSLCDITHGTVREKASWRSCRDGLPVPFDTFHRNDQPPEVRAATGDVAPVVVADTGDALVTLLDGVALDRCQGDPQRLTEAVRVAVAAAGLRWP